MFCAKCGAKLNFADADIHTVRGEKVFYCKDLGACFERFKLLDALRNLDSPIDKKA